MIFIFRCRDCEGSFDVWMQEVEDRLLPHRCPSCGGEAVRSLRDELSSKNITIPKSWSTPPGWNDPPELRGASHASQEWRDYARKVHEHREV